MSDPDKDEWYAGARRDPSIEARLGALERKAERIEIKVAQLETTALESNALLREIRDVLVVGKLGTAAIKWLGTLAVAGLAIWAAVYALLHGVPLK
jgi:hypothetical protein